MRKCEHCGFVKLSPQEQKIVELLPSNSFEIAEKLGITKRHASTILGRLEKAGAITGIGRIDKEKTIIYDRIKEEPND